MCILPLNKLIRSPQRFLALPVYVKESQLINSSKVGSHAVPKVGIVDIDNIFDGQSLCILDYIAEFNDGEYCKPLHVMYLVKTGVRSSHTGWECDYDNQAKVVLLQECGAPKATGKGKKKNDKPVEMNQSDRELSDLNDDDFDDVSVPEWDESEVEDEEPSDGESPSARKLNHDFCMKDDDRRDISKEMSGHVDVDKYAVYTSRRLNRVIVMWRNREKIAHRAAHKNAVKSISSIPGARAMHGSRSSKLSLHGLAECVKRAKEWQQWHSVVVPSYLAVSFFYISQTNRYRYMEEPIIVPGCMFGMCLRFSLFPAHPLKFCNTLKSS